MNDQYYKLPYAFFENEKYRGLTANERDIYCVLYARYELSYRNNDSHDSDGTFVYYTVKGLMSYVGLSNKTVVNGLQKLEALGLITRKKAKSENPTKYMYMNPKQQRKRGKCNE